MKLLYCLTFLYFTEETWQFKNSVTVQNTDITIRKLDVLYEKYSASKPTRYAYGNQKSQQVSEICFFQIHLISMQAIYCVILHRCSQTSTFLQHCTH